MDTTSSNSEFQEITTFSRFSHNSSQKKKGQRTSVWAFSIWSSELQGRNIYLLVACKSPPVRSRVTRSAPGHHLAQLSFGSDFRTGHTNLVLSKAALTFLEMAGIHAADSWRNRSEAQVFKRSWERQVVKERKWHS